MTTISLTKYKKSKRTADTRKTKHVIIFWRKNRNK